MPAPNFTQRGYPDGYDSAVLEDRTMMFMPTASNYSAPFRSAWDLSVPRRYWRCHREAGVFVVTMTTRYLFDDVLAEGFFPELVTTVVAAGTQKLVLDFEHVEAISGAALEGLEQLASLLEERRGRLVLCGMSEQVAEMFHVAALSRTAPAAWKTKRDVAAAIASLNQWRS